MCRGPRRPGVRAGGLRRRPEEDRGRKETHVLETLSSEELVFIKAIDRYKLEKNKSFLSWTEVLKIVKDLGYRRTLDPEAATVPPRPRGRKKR